MQGRPNWIEQIENSKEKGSIQALIPGAGALVMSTTHAGEISVAPV